MKKKQTNDRRLNGLIVVDKPAEMSSAGLVARVKKIFGSDKAGHAGTLDPFATGVMLCLLNRATRLAPFFLHADKTYRATLCLGIETDTLDGTGTVTATAPVHRHTLSDTDILRACESFEGESQQSPPAYSAVKHQGTPLYKLARKGITVKKPARRIMISSLVIEQIDLPRVTFCVTCSGGTYIRTLSAHIGASLGCGAHLEALRRIETGGFSITEAASLDDLEQSARMGDPSAQTINMNDALRQIPAYPAAAALADKIRHGRVLDARDLDASLRTDARGYFKIVTADGGLLAVMEKKEDTFGYCCVFPAEGSPNA